MAVIKKKTWPELFGEIVAGRKTFDLRINDFEIADGDTLVLEEWDPKTKLYTGRTIEKKVGYVFKFKPEELAFNDPKEVKEKGLQIISLL